MPTRPNLAARLAAAVLLAAASGCSSADAPCPGVAPCGVYVTRTTLEGIAPGTAQGSVRTMLGEPTAIETGAGREQWIWCCEAIEGARSQVLLLTRRAPGPASTTARIEFEAGRVVRAWIDAATTVASND